MAKNSFQFFLISLHSTCVGANLLGWYIYSKQSVCYCCCCCWWWCCFFFCFDGEFISPLYSIVLPISCFTTAIWTFANGIRDFKICCYSETEYMRKIRCHISPIKSWTIVARLAKKVVDLLACLLVSSFHFNRFDYFFLAKLLAVKCNITHKPVSLFMLNILVKCRKFVKFTMQNHANCSSYWMNNTLRFSIYCHRNGYQTKEFEIACWLWMFIYLYM